MNCSTKPKTAFLFGGLVLGISLHCSPAAAASSTSALPGAAAATYPEQAWAHKSKKIDLLRNGAPTVSSNAMDRMLIEEAFARYGIAYDEVRLDVLESLFTADAMLEVTEGPKTLSLKKGREAILQNFASALSQQGDQRRHAISNVVFEKLTKSDATVLAYGIVTVAADGLKLGATVIYSADLRREDDGPWRFSRLLIGMDSYAGTKPNPDK